MPIISKDKSRMIFDSPKRNRPCEEDDPSPQDSVLSTALGTIRKVVVRGYAIIKHFFEFCAQVDGDDLKVQRKDLNQRSRLYPKVVVDLKSCNAAAKEVRKGLCPDFMFQQRVTKIRIEEEDQLEKILKISGKETTKPAQAKMEEVVEQRTCSLRLIPTGRTVKLSQKFQAYFEEAYFDQDIFVIDHLYSQTEIYKMEQRVILQKLEITQAQIINTRADEGDRIVGEEQIAQEQRHLQFTVNQDQLQSTSQRLNQHYKIPIDVPKGKINAVSPEEYHVTKTSQTNQLTDQIQQVKLVPPNTQELPSSQKLPSPQKPKPIVNPFLAALPPRNITLLNTVTSQQSPTFQNVPQGMFKPFQNQDQSTTDSRFMYQPLQHYSSFGDNISQYPKYQQPQPLFSTPFQQYSFMQQLQPQPNITFPVAKVPNIFLAPAPKQQTTSIFEMPSTDNRSSQSESDAKRRMNRKKQRQTIRVQ